MSKIEQLTDALGERIRSGEWEECLPPRNVLSQEYGVSPATISIAIRSLQREGLVNVISRKGAFVATGREAAPKSAFPRIGLIGSYIPPTEELTQTGPAALFKQLIFEGIWEAANTERCPLTLIPEMPLDEELTPAFCRAELGVESLIFLGGEQYETAAKLRRAGFPVILANKPVHPTPLNYIDYDNAEMLRDITKRFIAAGHRRIGVIHAGCSVPDYISQLKKEFVSTLYQGNVFYPIEDYWQPFKRHLEKAAFQAAVDAAIDTLLNLPEPPTALFCWSISALPFAMQTLQARGRRFPEEISVATSAFDSPEAALLSGFVAPHRELGRKLVQELLKTVRDPFHTVQELLPLSFIDKATIAPPRRDE